MENIYHFRKGKPIVFNNDKGEPEIGIVIGYRKKRGTIKIKTISGYVTRFTNEVKKVCFS